MAAASSWAAPPGTARRRRRERPRPEISTHYVERGRVVASVTLPIVTVVLLLAVHGQWWEVQYVSNSSAAFLGANQEQYQYVVVTYLAGGTVECSSFSLTTPDFTPCDNVSGQLNDGQGAWYAGLNDGLIALVGLGALASAFTLLANFGVRFGRVHLMLMIGLAFTLLLVASSLLVVTTFIGHGPLGSAFCSAFSGNLTTCPGFWGSSIAFPTVNNTCLTCDDHVLWGAGYAYYEALIAVVVDAVTVWLLWTRRKRPFTLEEQRAWFASQRAHGSIPTGSPAPSDTPAPTTGAAGSPSAYPPTGVIWTRPPVDATHPGFNIAVSPWTCPNCATANSRWARLCKACRADRPPE